ALRARGTGETEELPVDMVFRSIGYKGLPLPGLPFDDRGGVIPNRAGRVIDPAEDAPLPRVYTSGWIKRGPNGVIGTNKNDSIETVRCMIEDAPSLDVPAELRPDPAAIDSFLRDKGVRVVSFADWKRIDEAEVAKGQPQERPRVKFASVEEMLRVLGE
ncbi:MAG: NADP oxidoreductase, partial [SAR324 cluster bacterium]|nr:NADP oxidoreductase [SAR324 cluster bacterium]